MNILLLLVAGVAVVLILAAREVAVPGDSVPGLWLLLLRHTL